MYPTKLTKIINLFESLPEDERRETLVSYADNAKNQEPRESENFDLVDVRKDEECTDTVGVYLHVDENEARIVAQASCLWGKRASRLLTTIRQTRCPPAHSRDGRATRLRPCAGGPGTPCRCF